MPLSSVKDFVATTFDYVIIGGGAAGLVLAARLSEDASVRVGVLEAGQDHSKNPLVSIPGLALQTTGNPDLDWDFRTTPQKGTHGRKHVWPRGKGLGGSAMINTMMYSNPSKRDLDAWEQLGNKGWNWSSLQPYFRKLETYNAPDKELGKTVASDYVDLGLRGTDGPIQTSFSEPMSDWLNTNLKAAAKNAGYPAPHDPRLGTSLGVYSQLVTTDPKTHTRSYSYSGYIEPNLGRANLQILTNAKAGRILFDSHSSEAVATGVEFSVDGETHHVSAAREVICCAGSIQTPQILELSGIGDRKILDKFGIKVAVDNPAVGDNLQDHPMVGVIYQNHDDVPTAEAMRHHPELAAQAMEAYQTNGAGILGAAIGNTGFASLHMACPDMTDEQVNAMISKAESFQSTATRKQLQIQERHLRDPEEAMFQWLPFAAGLAFNKVEDGGVPAALEHDLPGAWTYIGIISTHLFSRGSIHITSADPQAHPAIDPNYFSHPLDAELMGRGILHARDIARTEPLKSKFKLGADGDLISMPRFNGPVQDPKTVDEAMEFVRWNAVTCYHPIGTCSMLPRNEGGVVDDELRVYGTKNVRVIDASIFPLHVQGNIMSLVYAVAERAADVIRERI